MASLEQTFFDTVARREVVRPSVRAVIHSADGRRVLVQRPVDSVDSFAFLGGEYEIGDTFETRIRQEIEEETNARLVSWEYLFVVENRFESGGTRIHGLEHYVRAVIDRDDVVSREDHLVQEWLDIADLPDVTLRPTAVRDLVIADDLASVRHLVIDGWTL